jgi:DNA-binding NarL/FixJ family response regulator
MKQEIRILIADDHPLMRQGLRQVIEIEPNLKIVGEAGNGSEALAMIEELKPDAAILDVDMPHQDWLSGGAFIACQEKSGGDNFSDHAQRRTDVSRRARPRRERLRVKRQRDRRHRDGDYRSRRGRTFTSLPMTTYFTRRQNYNHVPDEQQLGLSKLTPTEYRILKFLADYKTNKDIAEELSVSPRTVETHRARICQKLYLQGSHALMKFAVQYKSLL